MPLYHVSGAVGRADALTAELYKSVDVWPLGPSAWLVSTDETADRLSDRLARATGAPARVAPVPAADPGSAPVEDVWGWLNGHR
jgi:hypothetical protein